MRRHKILVTAGSHHGSLHCICVVSNDERVRSAADPSVRPEARPTEAVPNDHAPVPAAPAGPEPVPADATTAQPPTSFAELSGPSEALSETTTPQRPESAPETVAQRSGERRPDSAEQPGQERNRAEDGAGTEGGNAAEADGKVEIEDALGGVSIYGSRSPPREQEGGHVSADGGPGREGGVTITGGLGGWLPRIGEDSPFVERGGQARGELRGPLEELVNLSRAEGAGGGGQEGTAAREAEAEPEMSEEVPGMDLREVLEQLVALEDARSSDAREALRILGEREDRARPQNAEEGGRGPGMPRKAESASELRQSLEEFIALERELYEKELQKERLRGRLEAGVGTRERGGLLERRAENVGGSGRNRGEERREDGRAWDRDEEGGVDPRALGTAAIARDGDVSMAAVPGAEAVSRGASELAAEQMGLANPGGLERLEVNTARQALGHWGLDYASSDFTLMSSPTSGLSPFSLLTSPLSNFSEDDLDVLLGVHVSSFELGNVSGPGIAATLREGETAEFDERRGLNLNAGERLHVAEGRVANGLGLDSEPPAERVEAVTPTEGGTSALGVSGGITSAESWPKWSEGHGLLTEREESERTQQPSGSKEPHANVSSSAPTSSSLLTSGGTVLSAGTGLSNRTEREAGTFLPSSELTMSGTVPSTVSLPTSTTERSETAAADVTFPPGHSSLGSQTAPGYPPSSPGASQPVTNTLDTDGASAPGDFEPTIEEEWNQRAAPTATLPGEERQRPVDDIFARLKRELDEFDERLDAVRTDVFAQGGVAARLPSSTSGEPMTSPFSRRT